METRCRYSDTVTPRKQHTLALLIRAILNMIRRRRTAGAGLVVRDMAGGEGRYPRLQPADRRYPLSYSGRWILASPPVLLRALAEVGVAAKLEVYENDPRAYNALRTYMLTQRRQAVGVPVALYCGDSQIVAPASGRSINYCDMSGPMYPFAALLRLLNGRKRTDGIMFFNAGGHKRQVGAGRGMPLTQFFKQLKKRHVYVQLTTARYGRQLVFVYATDQQVPSALTSLDFRNVKTAVGRRLLYTITHNKVGDKL